MGAVMTARDEAVEEITNVVRDAVSEAIISSRNNTLDCVEDLIRHEIQLTGDGIECLKRVQRFRSGLAASPPIGGDNGS